MADAFRDAVSGAAPREGPGHLRPAGGGAGAARLRPRQRRRHHGVRATDQAAHRCSHTHGEPRLLPGASAGYGNRSRDTGVRGVVDVLTERKRPLTGPLGASEYRGRHAGLSSLTRARAASGSLNHFASSSVYSFHWSGTSSSAKIAVTGHTGSQAPQSMHSSGSM